VGRDQYLKRQIPSRFKTVPAMYRKISTLSNLEKKGKVVRVVKVFVKTKPMGGKNNNTSFC
jgi:hypothetical protein